MLVWSTMDRYSIKDTEEGEEVVSLSRYTQTSSERKHLNTALACSR